MYHSVTDPFEKAMARHGFSADLAKLQAEAKRREQAERSRQYQIKRARRQILAPTWVVDLILLVAEERGVSPADIVSLSRRTGVVAARHEAIYRAKMFRPKISLKRLGMWFRRDHTSIGHALASYQRQHPDATIYTRHSIDKRHASTAKWRAKHALDRRQA